MIESVMGPGHFEPQLAHLDAGVSVVSAWAIKLALWHNADLHSDALPLVIGMGFGPLGREMDVL